MRISLIQSDIKWADIQENLHSLEQMVEDSESADLYVFPEMFSTGFAIEPLGIADNEGVTLHWMRKMADRKDAAFAGSVAVQDADGTYRNRFYFVEPGGKTAFYDKRHLFGYGGEGKHYTSGKERTVIEWRGVRILLQICYDLRFPVFSRNNPSNPYDLILYVANWPETRRKVWDLLLHARALENQCYVAGVNRVGDDKSCHYNGGTILIDAYGRDICSAEDNVPCSISSELNLDKLYEFRRKFPVLKDADTI